MLSRKCENFCPWEFFFFCKVKILVYTQTILCMQMAVQNDFYVRTVQSIPLKASLLWRQQERLPWSLQLHRGVQPQLPEERSVSPDRGSPRPPSSVPRPGASCPPALPGTRSPLKQNPRQSGWASLSSPANLAADSLSLCFPGCRSAAACLGLHSLCSKGNSKAQE